MNIIDGKKISSEIRAQVKCELEKYKENGGDAALAVIIVGDDPASRIYVNNKKKACAEVGIRSLEYALPAETTEDELIALIKKLNDDDEVDGILCQLPVPKGIDGKKIINAISVEKDVDGFSHNNMGRLTDDDYGLLPCTPAGILHLIKSTGTEIAGKNCVVVGRSNIVGKPVALLMLNESATVTVCHSKTQNLAEYTNKADILISAVGKADFITADMVKDGAIVIDVGMNRNAEGKLCGDVAYGEVAPKCSYITPVPGGVGPMTIAMLMQNTLTAAKNRRNKGD